MNFGIALTSVSSISLAAPNRGGGPGKMEKQCKDERTKCLRVDIANDRRNSDVSESIPQTEPCAIPDRQTWQDAD